MIRVSDKVRNLGYLTFKGKRPVLLGFYPLFAPSLGMFGYPLPDFVRQVKSSAVVLKYVYDPYALKNMFEPAGKHLVQSVFAGVTERSVTEVVTERYGFG